ncbi:MAG: hypothetical protein AABY07_02415, partial [Nanoarchaeota archaeon]
ASTHSQPLANLVKGDYSYSIRCLDLAGNEATGKIEFTVGEDLEEPRLVYVYKDFSNLFIILNEASTCEYSSQDFVFGQGTKMSELSTTHSAPLQFSNYMIKCQDEFQNDLEPIEIII